MKLKSKQEEIFEVEKEVACRSVTVKNMVDDTGLDTPVPLPMVDSKILIKVIEYCKYHRARLALARELRAAACASRACEVETADRTRTALRVRRRCRQSGAGVAAGGREERLG